MFKTFNCGVGFCLIIKSKKFKKIKKFFPKKYKPYIIGKISKKNTGKLNEKLTELKKIKIAVFISGNGQ